MRVVTLDTETSGVDVYEDRIVTAFVGALGEDGEWVHQRDWLLNPGVEIPQGAIEVHGITNEEARANGLDPEVALQEIITELSYWLGEELPLVVFNAPFDLTLLREEAKRHGVTPLNGKGVRVIDPLVIDKAWDPYRKGSRKLVDVAPIYDVPVEYNAHDAGADCLMAGRIALKMLEQASELDNDMQKRWKREQAASFQNYLRHKAPLDKRDPNAEVDGSWPIKK